MSTDLAAASTDRPVVLFDGVCNLCNGSVQFLVARDPEGHLRFASQQSEVAQGILARHGAKVPEGDPDSILVVADGRVYEHSDAVLRLTRELSAPWRWGVIFKVVPRFIRDAVYKWIARNRYRWFGKKDQCMVPTRELRQRFLT